MNKIFNIEIETLTPFNISTGNKSNSFIKNMTIRDINGQPYISGSSIKGLIRDNYRMICDNEDHIFGAKFDKESRIIVDNLTLAEDKNIEDKDTIIRFGNAIDRYRKVAKENALYSKETVSGKFRGKIYLYDVTEEEIQNIDLAVKMITSIGGSKSTGFGKVKIEFDEADEEETKVEESVTEKFILEFNSPLVIGGKQKSSNFVDSDDVIKGSVVRASFAKIILNNCPVRNINKDGKINWVYYRNQDACKDCKVRKTCESFSKIKFSYFYPLGTECIPLSSKMCKKNKHHGFYDVLLGEEKCAICAETNPDDAKIDFETGLRTKPNGKIKLEKYSVTKSMVTKNAINPYSKTSKDNMLYSVDAVSATHVLMDSENKIEDMLIYEGSIEGIPKDELKYFKNLRVGSDTTVGFGKCTLKSSNIMREKKNLIKEFNKEYAGDKEDSRKYIAIKFNSDCSLDFNFLGGYMTTEDLKKSWTKALLSSATFKNEDNLVNDLRVEKVFTEIINYRGYDGSKAGKDKREDIKTIASKGSVIVFSALCSEEELYNYFDNIKGFGDEQENGFGDFEIYFGGLEYGNEVK